MQEESAENYGGVTKPEGLFTLTCVFSSHSQRTWPSIDAYKMLEKNNNLRLSSLH